eukprot:TRINITY_DN1290_c0_g1_i2.p1 TRINITY_DN1290_c0_g1~~TRINITY_DN1290_c0_g1_i2.p1  ORF type:complete len:191 (-),score=53.51 TRINITY_DN1290_c0_g1_i2:26-598(-)
MTELATEASVPAAEEVAPSTSPSSQPTPPPSASETVLPEPAPVQYDVDDLTRGFVASLRPPLDQVSAKLQELNESQLTMIAKLQSETTKITTLPDIELITQTLSQVNTYQSKAAQLRRDMSALSERMAKLKKRAAAAQQRKVQAEAHIADQRDKMMARERQLTAQPSKTLLTKESSVNTTAASSSTPKTS